MKVKSNSEIWRQVKYLLRLQCLSFCKLADLYGVDRSNFTSVKRKPSPKYEKIISQFLGYQPQEIWPDRYTLDGNPSRCSSRYRRHEFFINRASKKIKRIK
jgi:Ner family transcriptional regulator